MLLHHQEGQQFLFSAFSNCEIGLLLIVASQSLQPRGILFFSNQSIVVCIFFSVIFLVQYLVFWWETKTVVLTFALLSYCEKKNVTCPANCIEFLKKHCNLQSALPKLVQNANISSFSDKPKPSYFNSSMQCLVFFWQAKIFVLIFAILSYCEKKIVTCPADFIEFLKNLCNLQSALPKLVQNANISSFSDKPKPSYFNSSMHSLVFFWQAKTVVLTFALLSYCEKKIVTCPAKFIEFLKKLCNLQSALPKIVQNANVSSFSDKPKPPYFNSSMHCLVFFWQAKTVVLIFALLSCCEKKIVTCPAHFIELLKNLCNLQSALPKLVLNANISSFSDKPKPSYFNSSMHCLVFFWQAKTVVLIFALLSYCEKKIVTCPAHFIEFLKNLCNLQSALPKLVQNANISSFSDKPKPSYFNSSMQYLVFFWQAKTVVLTFAHLSYCEKKIVTCPAKFIEFLKKLCNLQSALPKLVLNANISSFSDKPKPSYFNSSMHCLVFFWQAKTVVLIFALLSYCEKKMLLVLHILFNFWKIFVISKVPFLN